MVMSILCFATWLNIASQESKDVKPALLFNRVLKKRKIDILVTGSK